MSTAFCPNWSKLQRWLRKVAYDTRQPKLQSRTENSTTPLPIRYITSALQRTDMKAVGLQLALDLMHEKEHRDLITGLKSRTNAGRPNWNKVFTQLREQNKGKITVFYCGNPVLAKMLRLKCEEFGFGFKKEVF